MDIKLNLYYNSKVKNPHLFTKLVKKDDNERKKLYYNVYFVKEWKNTQPDGFNKKSIELTIDENAISIVDTDKTIFIKYQDKDGNVFNHKIKDIEYKQKQTNFEKTPKFTDVFEFAPDDDSSNDSLKF